MSNAQGLEPIQYQRPKDHQGCVQPHVYEAAAVGTVAIVELSSGRLAARYACVSCEGKPSEIPLSDTAAEHIVRIADQRGFMITHENGGEAVD